MTRRSSALLLALVALLPSPSATNTADANGYFGFTDLETTNYSQRYYRVLTQ